MGQGAPQPMILVRFVAAVEGADPSDGSVFLSKRHWVAAVSVRQDRGETVFVNDQGDVVARWATRLVEHVEWPDETKEATAVNPSVGTLEWRKKIQERHPNAYQPWAAEEDARLTEEFRDGLTLAQMASSHERRPGGIAARLVRMGLIAPDTREDEIGRERIDGPDTQPLADSRLAPSAVAVGEPPMSAQRPPPTIVEVTNDDCRHDLRVGTCSICEYDDRPNVYITAGGRSYHADPACPALLQGQLRVEARGGRTEAIEMVHRGSARLEGRDPCLRCNPK